VQIAPSSGSGRRVILIGVIVFAVAVVGFGVFDAVALPGCSSCHDRDGFRSGTAAAPHAQTDCRSCHVPTGAVGRLGFGFREAFHMMVPLPAGSPRDAAAVPDSRCLSCHSEIDASTVTASGIRIAHKTCSVGAGCTDCHGGTAHGAATAWPRSYDMDRCLACHVNAKQTECDLCHQGRTSDTRVSTGSFAVTHGPQWRTTHGMGDPATCTVCHQAGDCVACHGPGLPHGALFVETHATFAADKKAECDGCHARTFCDGCHGTPMPHGAQFTAGHAKAAASQPAICKRCHADSDCTVCHEMHVHPGGAVGGVVPKRGGN
jgi:hypothetical protein